MTINATVLVCDEIRFETSGKLFLIGMYPANIAIPTDDVAVGQLIFLFHFDCPIDEPPSTIAFEVTLPGGEPQRSVIQVDKPEANPKHTRWLFRHALTIQGQSLRLGKIGVRVTVDGQELDVSSPWIELLVTSPTVSPPPSEQSPTSRKRKAKRP